MADNPISVKDVSERIDSMVRSSVARGWILVKEMMDGGAFQSPRRKGLLVVFSISQERDNRWWVHISCSYRNHLPSWDDVVYVRDEFLGKDTWALQVIPSREDYDRVQEYCIHVWHCLNGAVTPEFRKGFSGL